MPVLDFVFGTDSPIQLGQVLTDPSNPARGLLSKDVIASIISSTRTAISPG